MISQLFLGKSEKPVQAEKALREAEKELREAKEKYQAIFNWARDGIVLIDWETGRITEGNPEFEKQTGRKLDHLKQKEIWDLRHPEKVETVRKKFLEIREKRTGGSVELEFQKPDGELVPVEFYSSVGANCDP